MGIDGGECHVHDFKFGPGIGVTQLHLQVTGRAIRRFRVAHGRGFAEDKNPDRARWLDGPHPEDTGVSGVLWWEEAITEGVILDVIILAADFDLFEKMRVKAVTGQSERHL